MAFVRNERHDLTRKFYCVNGAGVPVKSWPALSTIVLTPVLSVGVLVAPVQIAAQGDPSVRTARAGCPPEPAAFHKCALEKAKAFRPARTPDGQPDMQGHWEQAAGASWPMFNLEGKIPEEFYSGLWGKRERVEYHAAIINPPDGRIPYQPWARAKAEEYFISHNAPTKLEQVPGHSRCRLAGVPRQVYTPQSDPQILQIPGYVLMLHEFAHAYRVIQLDVGGAPLPERIKLVQGESRGRWEGNTLVVEVTNQTAITSGDGVFNTTGKWLDAVGNIHTDALRVVERWTLIDRNTIHYEPTLTDPKAYTRPFTFVFGLTRNTDPDIEIYEHACHEGERDLAHTVK